MANRDESRKYGVHVSIAGGLTRAAERARSLGCTAVQIFSRNPRGWRASPLSPAETVSFACLIDEAAIEPVIVHAPYLINLASPDERIYGRSLETIAGELHRCRMLGASYVVTHIGSHMGKGEEFGVRRVAGGVKAVLRMCRGRAMLLLENTAGGGNTIGHSFRQLGRILSLCGHSARLGFCFDTAHAFAAGYDLGSEGGFSAMLEEVEEYVGIERLKVIHFNDSKGEAGSRIDRHEHLGEGRIGLEGLARVARCGAFPNPPFILETPKDKPDADKQNLTILKKLLNVQCGTCNM